MTAQIHPAASRSFLDPPAWTGHDKSGYPAPPPHRDEAPIPPPPGFPSRIQCPMAWSKNSDVSPESQILELGPNEVVEVEQAMTHFLSLELDGSEVARENFPLPTLGARLQKHAIDIHRGSGLCIIRGIRPGTYSPEVNTIMFLGLASYIGAQRGVQTAKGAMLTHIYESPSWKVPRERRHGIHTNRSLPFHNDMGCEILAMHIRNCAAKGGGTYVASAAAIYNAVMKANPLVVHTLAQRNWPVQIARQGTSQFVLAPLLGYESGNLMISVDPGRIGPHPAVIGNQIPELLPAQKEALALLQKTAVAQQIKLPTVQGDMVFINNWSILHARDSYVDDGMAARHLVRLWLRNPELGQTIPDSMKAPWEASFGARAKKIVNRQYPVAPMPEYIEPKFTNGSAAFVMEESDKKE